jgi:lipoprotein-releasing system permease protein
MYKPLSAFIGLRYLRAKKQNHFISFISLTSMLGIALGVTTLITVISGMNGFEKELRARILGAISHATIQPLEKPLDEWREVISRVNSRDDVVASAPYIEVGAWLQANGSSAALVRGIAPEYESSVSDVATSMVNGGLDDLRNGEYGIVLGVGLAVRLRVGLGDKVTIIAPRLKSGPFGASPLMKRFTVVGMFEFGEHENDTGLAMVHISDAARLLRMPEESIGGIRLKLDDLDSAWWVAREISEQLDGAYRVRDWSQERGNLFQAVRTEKTVMWVILSLIIAVAAFNMVSMLVMVVTDKQADIGFPGRNHHAGGRSAG